MKEKWRVVSHLLEQEYGMKFVPSYEGWGSGYDPMHLPLLEMWARAEVEEVPPAVRKPEGIVFDINQLSRKSEEEILTEIRHEVSLLETNFYLWRLGQREFFRFGYPPTSFLVLYAALESLKADKRITERHPHSSSYLQQRYLHILSQLEDLYPHHLMALGFIALWTGREDLLSPLVSRQVRSLARAMQEYLSLPDGQAYDVLMEEFFGKYRVLLEEAQELNFVDLLLEEARGRNRQDGHRGRIMTDVLKKLPPHLQDFILENRDLKAGQIPSDMVKDLVKHIRNLPDWMKDYMKQMSYLNMLERDVSFLRLFLPKTLEVELEHRGFLTFLFKPWQEERSGRSLSSSSHSRKDLSDKDKQFLRETGLTEEEYRSYRLMLKDVLPHVEALRRKFEKLLPKEEEYWWGRYHTGRRLNLKKLSVEVPTGRGRIYQRRVVPKRKELAFKLVIDVSSSMRKEEKLVSAMKALLLVAETLSSMGMPLSVDLFSERVMTLKDFDEDYRNFRSKFMQIPSMVGGATNIELALLKAFDHLSSYCKTTHRRGVLILFSDGEPTRGLKGTELKKIIDTMKKEYPLVGVGVGQSRNYIEEYFDRTAIKVSDISRLPSAFSFVLENYFRRLTSVD